MYAFRKRRSNWGYSLSAALTLAAAVTLPSAAEAKPKFVTFTVNGEPTQPTGINERGAVTGYVLNLAEGFVRQSDGTIEIFAVPGALNTHPMSINKKGEVTGYYDADHNLKGVRHGFLRKPDGTIRTFKIPKDNNGDYPVAVNSSGTIFGYFKHGPNYIGFVRAKNGTITSFDCPSEGHTTLAGANDLGVAAGACNSGAFLRSPDGTFTFFSAGQFTDPTGIGGSGSVTGTIGDQETLQGFRRTADGAITVFNVGQNNATAPTGINATDAITGDFNNAGTISGFVRAPDGTITIFDPEGSTNTDPASINDKGAITGFYVDKNDNWIGFIRFP